MRGMGLGMGLGLAVVEEKACFWMAGCEGSSS